MKPSLLVYYFVPDTHICNILIVAFTRVTRRITTTTNFNTHNSLVVDDSSLHHVYESY